MNSEKSKENPTFLIRFYNHLKRYYMIFGIVGLIIAGAMRKCIATKTPKNNEARSVANYLIKHSEEIYNNYKNKPSGTFTEPLTTDNENQNNESLKQEIEELKRKVEELSNNKTKSKPMSELEKQNIENNSK